MSNDLIELIGDLTWHDTLPPFCGYKLKCFEVSFLFVLVPCYNVDRFDIIMAMQVNTASTPVWRDDDFLVRRFACTRKAETHFTTVTEETATPYNVFWKEFFTDELLDHIVVETNRNESQRPVRANTVGHQKPWYDTNREELRAFLAITIIMGYHPTPQIHHHWSKEPSLNNPTIQATMSRDR